MAMFPCDFPGCDKSRLKKHTHFIGDMGKSSREIADYVAFAQMRGESVQIPGGSADDMAIFMTARVTKGRKLNAKEAEAYRKKLAEQIKKGKR